MLTPWGYGKNGNKTPQQACYLGMVVSRSMGVTCDPLEIRQPRRKQNYGQIARPDKLKDLLTGVHSRCTKIRPGHIDRNDTVDSW